MGRKHTKTHGSIAGYIYPERNYLDYNSRDTLQQSRITLEVPKRPSIILIFGVVVCPYNYDDINIRP